MTGQRPPVSVVLPFLGSKEEAREALSILTQLETREGDELIVADNTPTGLVRAVAPEGVQVVHVPDRKSASHARNAGVRLSRNPWVLFVDADCLLPDSLLDDYFAIPPGERLGVVAGEIEGSPEQDALLARWARSRRGQWVRFHVENDPRPGAVTANMLVRRAVWEELGGFRVGGGGDLDLSWRAQDAGWEFDYRPEIVVLHNDRETLRELVRQGVSYGSHVRRLRDLHGPVLPVPPVLAPVSRGIAGAAVWTLTGQFERAAFKLVDAVWSVTFRWGYIRGRPLGT